MTLETVFPILLGAAAILVGMLLLSSVLFSKAAKAREFERKRLLSQAELAFLGQLRAALPDHHVLAQVSTAALLKPHPGLDRKAWWAARGKIAQKIVDFVVLYPRTGDVVNIIELDDRSHNARKDAARDAIMAEGGYETVRFGPRPSYEDVVSRLASLRAANEGGAA